MHCTLNAVLHFDKSMHHGFATSLVKGEGGLWVAAEESHSVFGTCWRKNCWT